MESNLHPMRRDVCRVNHSASRMPSEKFGFLQIFTSNPWCFWAHSTQNFLLYKLKIFRFKKVPKILAQSAQRCHCARPRCAIPGGAPRPRPRFPGAASALCAAAGPAGDPARFAAGLQI